MSEENITMISTFLENTKLPPDFVIEKIELIKALKTCHHVYRDYLARNIWTLTHPENQLKRDLVDIYSSVYFVLDSILKGFFIVAMEWVSETGTGDIVVFDGYGTFLVIELKTTGDLYF